MSTKSIIKYIVQRSRFALKKKAQQYDNLTFKNDDDLSISPEQAE